MSQAFELYAQGFKLQAAGNRRAAWELYQHIIDQFPDSRESEYAQVQLDHMAPGREGHRAALVISTVALGLALITATLAVALWHGVREAQDKSEYYGHLSRAVTAENAGDDAIFKLHLARAREIDSGLPHAYLLMTDHHIRRKEFSAALSELKKCPVMDPEVRFYYDKIQKMTKEKGR